MNFRKLICLGLIATGTSFLLSAKKKNTQVDKYLDFKLEFISIGMGSNRWKMQPMFRAVGNKFIYSLEDAWVMKGEAPKKDILVKSTLRNSSIDSIMLLIEPIKDTLVYKSNVRVMSGGMDEISIRNGTKKILFRLHNAGDSTAREITKILNTYIPDKYTKLWISDHKSSWLIH